MSNVLQGIRVLDFGRYMAGPWCAALLADLGAEVMRIERIEGGEDRFNQYPISDEGIAASYVALNRNKIGITLNPLRKGASKVLERLVQSADVIVANLPDETLKRMGIDYDTLKSIKPDIILATVSAFDESGPYAGRVGLDGIAQAMSGAAFMSGAVGSPSKSFAPWSDILAGTYAAFGVLAAVRHRDKTGEGQRVSTDLLTTGVSALSWIHTEQAAMNINRTADGNRTQSSAPGDIFRTRDGSILMQTIGRPLFERWAELVGETSWLEDPRFADDVSRSNHRSALCERTQQWASGLTNDEAIKALTKARIPCGPVLSPQQLLDDPHIIATDTFVDVNYPGLQHSAKVMKHPIRYSSSSVEFSRRPPTLGEHTDEVLSALGFSTSELAEFRERGVV